MTLESQDAYLKIIEEDFEIMKKMLDSIRDEITQYSVFNQLNFYKPLKCMMIRVLEDALDNDNKVLNSSDNSETIIIN